MWAGCRAARGCRVAPARWSVGVISICKGGRRASERAGATAVGAHGRHIGIVHCTHPRGAAFVGQWGKASRLSARHGVERQLGSGAKAQVGREANEAAAYPKQPPPEKPRPCLTHSNNIDGQAAPSSRHHDRPPQRPPAGTRGHRARRRAHPPRHVQGGSLRAQQGGCDHLLVSQTRWTARLVLAELLQTNILMIGRSLMSSLLSWTGTPPTCSGPGLSAPRRPSSTSPVGHIVLTEHAVTLEVPNMPAYLTHTL